MESTCKKMQFQGKTLNQSFLHLSKVRFKLRNKLMVHLTIQEGTQQIKEIWRKWENPLNLSIVAQRLLETAVIIPPNYFLLKLHPLREMLDNQEYPLKNSLNPFALILVQKEGLLMMELIIKEGIMNHQRVWIRRGDL